jgi:hypothetical protein
MDSEVGIVVPAPIQTAKEPLRASYRRRSGQLYRLDPFSLESRVIIVFIVGVLLTVRSVRLTAR